MQVTFSIKKIRIRRQKKKKKNHIVTKKYNFFHNLTFKYIFFYFLRSDVGCDSDSFLINHFIVEEFMRVSEFKS